MSKVDELHEHRARLTRRASVALCLSVLAACGGSADIAAPELPYDDEYPAIGYGTNVPDGRLGQLAARVENSAADLSFRQPRGFLDSVLRELDIDPASQVLVFSRTSQQVGAIRPETPRAIYFNDDSYVAWIPGARNLELASYDPELGPVFYNVAQDGSAEPAMERKFSQCLRCHDTYGLGGGGVPRFLLGSGYTGTDGELVSHEAWILTSQSTPLRSRWGGWYVTGRHGEEVHLGNIVVERPEDLQDLEALRVGNVDDLSGLVDSADYLAPTSDIVALMVFEHQVEVQNLISRLRYEAAVTSQGETAPSLVGHVEALLRAMLMVDAVALTSPIRGSPAFTEQFTSRGPFARDGRSLRQLDLESRLFRYPLSYLIYSEAFAALQPQAKAAFFDRLDEILESTPEDDGFFSLTVADRSSIAAILADTLPGFVR
jgi:hypothetical protein